MTSRYNKLCCHNCGQQSIYAESENIHYDRVNNGKKLTTIWKCAQCQSQTIEVKPLAGHPHYHAGSEYFLVLFMLEAEPEDIRMEGYWDD